MMNGDLSKALQALTDSQNRLVEGQLRTEAALRELTGEVRELATAQRHTETQVASHRRQTDTDRLLDEFEARLEKMESERTRG